MEKLTNQLQLSKIAKGALAIVLAGSVTFSATHAFAEETNSKTDVELQADASTDSTQAENVESPTLLPGDFFYFAKILLEKITLALTFDDVKEAKLIAAYASERLAEAEGLFAAGDEEAALDTINAAMEYMKNADQIIEDQQQSEEPAEKTEVEDPKGDETVFTDEQASNDEVIQEVEKNVEDQEADETGVDEVKTVLSQNIIALTAAMEKVKNPVAKAALQKNIEKSYTKLALKIEKWEKKKQKKVAKKHLAEEQMTTDEMSEETNVEANVESSTETEIGTDTPAVEAEVKLKEEANEAVPAETEQAKWEVKAIRNAAHQEMKQFKQEAKQKEKEIKDQVKEKRVELKKTWKESQNQHKDNNGKGN